MMKNIKPLFFENSKVPVWLSKLAPIEIGAITLFCFVFSRGEISEKTKRHETIHYQQYLETFVIGFLLIYLFDYLYSAIIKKKGFTRDSYLAIRFEQEAWECDDFPEYLSTRKRFSWLSYPLGGK
mgnify:CR=1 FL=1|tara:strand:+ start:106 stop:480 length:375 start_codon:yes stop_codon:yes gene_type:complete